MISKRRKQQTSPTKKKKKNRIDLAWTRGDNDDNDDEHLLSEDDSEGQDEEESSSEEETTEAKKIRLARAYLNKLEREKDDSDEESVDENLDAISSKLQKQRLLKRGTLHRNLAHLVQRDVAHMASEISDSWISSGYDHLLKGHDLTPTCVAMVPSLANMAVSGSKDHSVICWDIETLQKTSILQKFDPDHRNGGEVLSIAACGKVVAVGKRDATVAIYDVRSQKCVIEFEGHKGPVTALAFQSNESLFTGSTDRCIRHYSVEEMAYIETLYGHQAGVVALDCSNKEQTPVSVGRDRTARVWKLAQDSHLIFRGGARLYPATSLAVLTTLSFLTGHEQDGTLCLWNANRKKAVACIQGAHHVVGGQYCGVSSLAACQQSDFAVSGSNDGYLRLWKILSDTKSKPSGMESIGKIPMNGFCNGIALTPDAKNCVVAVGQEPRLGRWERVAKAKNRIHVVQLRQSNVSNNSNKHEGVSEESLPTSSSDESSSGDEESSDNESIE